jgi:hypothetical protein
MTQQRIDPNDLIILRNHVPLRDVAHLLLIPWKMDDTLCRFECPLCKCFETGLHPKENLGRCFRCQKNFNPIDLVAAHRGDGFRTAVDWLMKLRTLMASDGYTTIVATQARRCQIKI